MNEKISYLDPIPVFTAKQGDFVFYVFKIDAKKLLEISYTSPRTQYNRTGIQRGLEKKRLKEIGNYLQGVGEKPCILPNSIIISLSEDSYVNDDKIYIANRKNGEAFILDGQHRLFAFDNEWAGETSFEILVSAFIDIKDEFKAYVFRTINEKQREINPTLVYDLIPMLRNNWIEFEDRRAQYLVEALNEDAESSWYDGISMLGTRERTISQASFIKAIKSLLKKDRIFSWEDFFEKPIQKELLTLYFNTVALIFKNAWKNKYYILCKSAGVFAMINILDLIIKDLGKKKRKLVNDRGLSLNEIDLKPYLIKIKDFDFLCYNVEKLYCGESGIRILTQELKNYILNPNVVID